MTCRCGFHSCYLCRADINKQGYTHFCQHFRERPGMPCTKCAKCFLYQDENTDVVVQQARRKAELDWEAGRVDSRSVGFCAD
jgi:hypothetical protein